jgi:2-dehydropantoate 2-reductase
MGIVIKEHGVAIVVVGGGAIGLLVAGRLAQTGQQVAVVTRPKGDESLRSLALHINHKGQTQTVESLPVATDLAVLPPTFQQPDLAILSVKSYDTAGALPTLTALDPALILTLQNGIGNEETLAASFGPDRLLSGAITSSVEPESPGHITVTKAGGICLAPVGANTRDKVAPWKTHFQAAEFPVQTYDNYLALKWSKALLNMLGNATAAILDMPVDAVYAHPELVALERQTFLEGVAVMRQLGVQPVNLPGYPTALLAVLMQHLPFWVLMQLLQRAIAGGRGGKAPSLQRDLQQGRTQSEGEYLYGAIARRAEEIGMVAKVNSSLWYILHSIVSGAMPWDYVRGKPERLIDMIGKPI